MKIPFSFLRLIGMEKSLHESFHVSTLAETQFIYNEYELNSTIANGNLKKEEVTMEPQKSNPNDPVTTVQISKIDQEDRKIIQFYLNNFKKNYISYVNPTISLLLRAVPYAQGVVLEINYEQFGQYKDEIVDEIQPNVDQALKLLNIKSTELLDSEKQQLYDKGLEKDLLIFSGTNFFGTNDKVYIIKDNSLNLWTEKAARKDVNKILEAVYN